MNKQATPKTPPEASSTETKPKTATMRAPLFARIVLIVLAVAVFLGIVLTMVNIRAAGTYNQATQSLQTNLKAAAKENADLNELKASQQQNDAQLSDAKTFSYVLLPSISQSIASNAKTSQQLTALINQALTAQNGGNGSTSSSNASGARSSSASSTPESSLNAEQRKKVDELLKQNQELQQSNASSSASTSSSPSSSSSSTTKPW
ncbi:DUF6466 family protein [Bifidobacterium aquikefiricola]|uniref:DUF6466 family protein n=1 Tax=Bifidobacterium aquikefiricola TaxID=3059038 RepID=A0AB39U5D3_9BIFI